jgi:DKNYY family
MQQSKYIYLFFILSLFGLGCEGSYKKKNGKVYYDKQEITVLDINSFESLNDVFAKDNKTGYYRGGILKGSMGKEFKALNEHYALDDKYVFYCDYYRDGRTYYTTKIEIIKIVPDAHPGTLKILDENYAKDDHQVYYKYDAFKVADVDSFTLLSDNFAKDNVHAYYYLKPIEFSDGASFEVINGNYAKDKNHVYYSYVLYDNTTDPYRQQPSNLILDADPASFKALSLSYGKDKNHAYYFNKLIKEIDLNTFTTDSVHSEYAHDALHIYFQGKALDQAAKSFTPLEEDYGKDQHHVYYKDSKINSADAASFIVLEKGYAKDKFTVYYKGVIVQKADPASFEAFDITMGDTDAKDKNASYFEGEKLK